MKKVLFLIMFLAMAPMHGSQLQAKSNEEVATILLQPSAQSMACTFSYEPFNGMTVVELVDASSLQAFDAQENPVPLCDNLKKAYEAMIARAERSLEKHCAQYGEMPDDGELAVTLLKGNQYIVHFGVFKE